MTKWRVLVDVPENRQVVLTLPPEVPPGRVELEVTAESTNAGADGEPIEIDLSRYPNFRPQRLPRSGVVREVRPGPDA